jgi:hypothetical protein
VLGLCFFSTLISGASRAITFSAIQVTHIISNRDVLTFATLRCSFYPRFGDVWNYCYSLNQCARAVFLLYPN